MQDGPLVCTCITTTDCIVLQPNGYIEARIKVLPDQRCGLFEKHSPEIPGCQWAIGGSAAALNWICAEVIAPVPEAVARLHPVIGGPGAVDAAAVAPVF
jgi:hypothetical protein